VNINVDGLAIRLFERKIRECAPWGYDENRNRLGISTEELFECVYESLSEKAKEKYGRDEADAMTDIALDSMVEKGQIEYVYEREQWERRGITEYELKHWMD
jgi:hypothetical protein